MYWLKSVQVFSKPFLGVPDLPMDEPNLKRKGLPRTVTVLDAPDGGKVYLVGTAHFSQKSQEDVSRVTDFYIYFITYINS